MCILWNSIALTSFVVTELANTLKYVVFTEFPFKTASGDVIAFHIISRTGTRTAYYFINKLNVYPEVILHLKLCLDFRNIIVVYGHVHILWLYIKPK